MRPAEITEKPELLIPAGSAETLKTAVRYGADAVYFGAQELSLRAKARNFAYGNLGDAVGYAHDNGVRAYLTANIFARNSDLREAEKLFGILAGLPDERKPDGILISDPGMLMLAKNTCGDIPLHLSTQANTTNAGSCRFWYEQGVRRAVLARELSLEEIREIRDSVPEDLELECFVHGAMCISYSGRCLLSRYMTGRDANRGMCAHPCRYVYSVVEETRPGEYYPVEEDEKGTAILASDDLCMLGYIPELVSSGINCLKVEGRMKNSLYIAAVTGAYRRALDMVCAGDIEGYRAALPALMDDIAMVSTRKQSTGLFFGIPRTVETGGRGQATILAVSEGYNENGLLEVRQKNRFFRGDTVIFLRPGGCHTSAVISSIFDMEGNEVECAPHPEERLMLGFENAGEIKADAGDVMCSAKSCR